MIMVLGDQGLTGIEFITSVQSLNENTNTQQIHQFWREMEMLSELRHDRIANLRAVVIQPQLRAMIFEYTDLGDLKNYLLARNPNSDMPSHAGPLTLEQQIDICHQVKYCYYIITPILLLY